MLKGLDNVMDRNKIMLAVKGGVKKLCEGDRGQRIVIILGFAGIALILISGFFGSEKSVKKSEPVVTENTEYSVYDYTKQLEMRLSDIISEIDGAGRAQVFLTLEGSSELVYATDEKQSSEQKNGGASSENEKKRETSYITVKLADGTQQAVKVQELEPKVRGVIVVCSGGDDVVVQEHIMKAVKTVFNISSTKVCILKSTD